MYKLSICILTHLRPVLFKRCLESALKVCPDAEILVNNDSNDIEPDNRAKYFYLQQPLNNLYEFLVTQATGTHIWFLEDDDVALKAPTMLDTMTVHRYINHELEIPAPDINHDEYQLSQCCIPKHLLDFSTLETECNCIHNDYHLVKHLPYRPMASIIFRQTYNGDNISFPESPKYRGLSRCNSCQWKPLQSHLR